MSLFSKVTNNLNLVKPKKSLKESEGQEEPIMVYMNTWGNYNEYGADLSQYGINSISEGWLTPEEALKFCKDHDDEECFINDIDNNTGIKLDINEYSSAVPTLEGLIKLTELIKNGTDNCAAEDIGAVYEAWTDYEGSDDINEFINFLDNGEYYVYDDVSNTYDLGKCYVDMLGGILFVGDVGSYLDKEQMKEDYQEDVDAMYDENDPDWYEVDDSIIDEDIASVVSSQNAQAVEDAFSNYFDYEELGEELDSDGGWYFVSDNKCVEIR